MIEIRVDHYVHIVAPGVPADQGRQILQAVGELKEIVTMNQEELKANLQAISDQTAKVFGEVSTQLGSLNTTIASLQDALAQAGNTSPEVDALVTQLKGQVESIDNLIPDATAA